MASAKGRLPILLYRACLRELPPILTRIVKLSEAKETSAISKIRYPHTRRLSLHNNLRLFIKADNSDKLAQLHQENAQAIRIQQMVKYLEAQRLYIELLERYNVGLLEGNQDRIRRAARRVGLDIAE